jgi:hypothetical protein
MQPDQLVLCLPHNLTTPGYSTITMDAANQPGSKTDTWQVWVWRDTQQLTYMQLCHCNATYKDEFPYSQLSGIQETDTSCKNQKPSE